MFAHQVLALKFEESVQMVTLIRFSEETTQTERGYGRQWVWTVRYHEDGFCAHHTAADLARLTA